MSEKLELNRCFNTTGLKLDTEFSTTRWGTHKAFSELANVPMGAQERKKKIQNSGMNLDPLINSIKTFKVPLYNYVQC